MAAYTRKHVLTFGAVVIVLSGVAAIPVLTSPKPKLEQVSRDWLELRKGIHGYGMDRCGLFFPPDTSYERPEKSPEHQTFELDPTFPGKKLFGPARETREFWSPLTTPIAYMKQLPRDPFNANQFYGYGCWNFSDRVPIVAFLHSPGPDHRPDITGAKLRDKINGYLESRRNGHCVAEDRAMLREMVKPFLYDPTNGTRSQGDLICLFDNPLESYFSWDKSSRFWIDAKLPLLEKGTSITIANWETGTPMPPPQNLDEYISREGYHQISNDLSVAAVMMRISETQSHRMRIRYRALEPLQNRLGVLFGDFFQHPHRLTQKELANLEQWRVETEQWWKFLDTTYTIQAIGGNEWMHVGDYYTILPIYGKSLLLVAARRVHQGDLITARIKLEGLRAIIRDLEGNASSDPYQRRVREELTRLIDETESAVLKAAPG